MERERGWKGREKREGGSRVGKKSTFERDNFNLGLTGKGAGSGFRIGRGRRGEVWKGERLGGWMNGRHRRK